MSWFINWVTDIVLWICFGVKELAVVLISMMPIIELRGAIPVGTKLDLGIWMSFLLSFLGSSLVCIPLLLLLPWVFNWRIFKRVKDVFKRKADKVPQKWKALGIFVFAAIPLPGTGVWTSSAVAVVLGFKFWKAALLIIAGNLVSGLAVVGLTALIGAANLDILLMALFVAFVVILVIFLYKVFRPRGGNMTPNTKQRIEKDLGEAFKALGLAESLANVSVSTVDICDYQCNSAFAIAKELNRKPLDLAKEIAGKFASDIATCEAVAPAFLNFKVKDEALVTEAQKILKSGKLPLASTQMRTVFFDYGGANIAKELHVGHLRSPIVGEALKRVYEALGARTIADVYLGDWGLQNGLILAELELRKVIKNGEFTSPVTLDLLNEVYPAASKKKESDKKFKARADEITLLMQQKQAPWFDLWKQMRKISVEKIKENYDRLGCTFNFYNGESDAQPYVETVLDILKKNSLAYESDNCLIMDVAKDTDTGPMPPIILQKYNGGDLYATNDVATIYYRAKDFKPDEIIYMTDARQTLHFEQVFRCAKGGALLPDTTALTHIGYGTMNGKDGKPFKTRAGGTIKFEDVVNLVTKAAQKRLAENGKPETQELAEKIGIAALKFADLSNNVRKDYVFDLEKFTSFEGKTGPYILYTIARINSLIAKDTNKAPSGITISDTTRSIIIKTLKLADAYTVAAVNYTLNGIVDAAYTLAAEFNLFYANTKILTEPDEAKRQSYLALCSLVKTALTLAMNTLAIDVVEEM